MTSHLHEHIRKSIALTGIEKKVIDTLVQHANQDVDGRVYIDLSDYSLDEIKQITQKFSISVFPDVAKVEDVELFVYQSRADNWMCSHCKKLFIDGVPIMLFMEVDLQIDLCDSCVGELDLFS